MDERLKSFEDGDEETQQVTSGVLSRRKMLVSLGLAGAAVVGSSLGIAYGNGTTSVTDAVYESKKIPLKS